MLDLCFPCSRNCSSARSYWVPQDQGGFQTVDGVGLRGLSYIQRYLLPIQTLRITNRLKCNLNPAPSDDTKWGGSQLSLFWFSRKKTEQRLGKLHIGKTQPSLNSTSQNDPKISPSPTSHVPLTSKLRMYQVYGATSHDHVAWHVEIREQQGLNLQRSPQSAAAFFPASMLTTWKLGGSGQTHVTRGRILLFKCPRKRKANEGFQLVMGIPPNGWSIRENSNLKWMT